jgi:protein-disulfide isomerase
MLHSRNIEHRIKVILAGRTPGRIGVLTFAAVLATSTIAVAAFGPLRTTSALSSTSQGGLAGIEHLSSQELALGHSSNVDRDRPKLLFFGDIECPSCRKAAPTFRQIRNAGYGVIFIHFPLKYHPHARLAAQAMVAAAKQGAEWQAYDALFSMNLTDQSIRSLGTKLGIDQNRFVADLESESTKQRVEDSYNLCNALKLNRVPTFFKLTPEVHAESLDTEAVRALARATK